METKLCGKCNQTNPISLFSKKTKSKDGCQPYCKKCCAKMSAKNYKRRQRLLGKVKPKAPVKVAKPTVPTVAANLPKGALVFIVPLSDAKDIQAWCDQAMRDYLLAKMS